MQKSKLIYIMGAGRSGSTILGILLGNLPDSEFIGEIYCWNLYKGIPNNSRAEVSIFWRDVIAKIPEAATFFHNKFFKNFEYHSSLANIIIPHRKLLNNYFSYTNILFNEVTKTAAKKYIIDSSHYPLRAYWLKKNEDLDIKLIYLYRNPVDVVESFRKKEIEHKPKNFIAANLYLFLVSTLSWFVYSIFSVENKMRVNYKDIIENTDRLVKLLEEFLDLPESKIFYDQLKTGNIFQSNRIRQQEIISLTRTESKTKFSWRYLTLLIQLPFVLLNRKSKYKNISL